VEGQIVVEKRYPKLVQYIVERHDTIRDGGEDRHDLIAYGFEFVDLERA
jgi:hypothetical protein